MSTEGLKQGIARELGTVGLQMGVAPMQDVEGEVYQWLQWQGCACMNPQACSADMLPHANVHHLCSNTDGMEVRSVGNSQVLKETALIEAFNLKVRALGMIPLWVEAVVC